MEYRTLFSNDDFSYWYKGFVGCNLFAQLNKIKDGKASNYDIVVDAVYEYDLDSASEELDAWCADEGLRFQLGKGESASESRGFYAR